MCADVAVDGGKGVNSKFLVLADWSRFDEVRNIGVVPGEFNGSMANGG